ncbi:MAG TPA: cytochrome C biogenesis protein CcdA [Lysinibacillus sp.]|uniref:Cytochrome C biogenesis protein CcdA n=3 Tax=Lysinibacillus TaxID=400634 RepID=A0A0N0UXJ7_9BACI|nr:MULTISPECIES: cytochrome c biogenesis protein CcdA [Lysinibacillus]EKU41047.1 cytochrome c-type biogenesis protein CcdA [Lysinibacillus fusiformis ZB2]WHP40808.1 cytochrome c biogenesis protein CcdA [Lysinibacillus boronitolerans]AJK85936.1 cytochrome C biogenesis protein CcdA [Lysinibacillus fusiformis]KGR89296.1 cytochrome C biogenesis protein CcdA [Lysinibacillus boronitolerans JCM 21713 = 10a = NBRC 103108]KHK52042.1 cytochrome C biogenesis protein CcdA [Lysinibacillus sp. A1]
MLEQLNLILAFGAGLLSFVSPCSLPLYPAFLSYITGISFNELKEEKGILRRKSLIHTLLFLLGFSIIFMALGFSTSFIGKIFIQYKELLRQFGAIFMVFFGLVILGFFKFDILQSEKKISFKKRPKGYFGSVLIGMGFAAGWTPCTGPILAGVIALGVSNPGQGMLYMLFYVLGFSIPFLIMSLFIGKMKFLQRKNGLFMKIGGAIMILMGVLLYFDMMTKIIAFLTPIFGGFTGF